jgi:hypothetical protein
VANHGQWGPGPKIQDVGKKCWMQMEPEFKGLLNILNKIPNNLFIKFLERVTVAIYNRDPCCGFNYKKNFINWAKTF